MADSSFPADGIRGECHWLSFSSHEETGVKEEAHMHRFFICVDLCLLRFIINCGFPPVTQINFCIKQMNFYTFLGFEPKEPFSTVVPRRPARKFAELRAR